MKREVRERLIVVNLIALNTPQQLAETLVRADAIAKRRARELEKLRAALEDIACYDELPKGSPFNLNGLDEPRAARVARAALEKKR